MNLKEIAERVRCPPGISLRYHPALDRIKIFRNRKLIFSLSNRQIGNFEFDDRAVEGVERFLEALVDADDRELSEFYEAMLTMRKRLQ